MSNMVLLVVDVQNALIDAHPYNEQRVIGNIRNLILTARDNQREVLFVRHDDGKGTELENGTYGWQFYDKISPNSNELIFEKHYNSAFRRTGLNEYLDKKNVDTIILVGLQTEYCIDATCKSAFDHDYKIIIPEETNTTFDNDYLSGKKLYEFYNYKIWNKRFAEVISVEEVKRLLTMPT
ncbi:cysteine hydrolase family protein [Desulfosporosinus sp. SB140]|uniref:cysteine hydrolase family protein n=1 Tax=Desulfosporosinus paludis TaxID=3115649 RepID=UPI003891049F